MEIIDLFDPDNPTFDVEYRRLVDSDSPYDVQMGQMMLDLLDQIRRGVMGPRLFASFMTDELWLNYSDDRGHGTTIRATVDHYDFASLVDGVPQFHFRLRYDLPPPHSPTNPETVEERTREPDIACDIIREAIKRSKVVP